MRTTIKRVVVAALLLLAGALALPAFNYLTAAHAAIVRGNAAFAWLAQKDATGKTRAELLEALVAPIPPATPSAK